MVKKIILSILGLIVVAILAVLGIAATKPNTYRVERSATIAAPPSSVYALVNDFNRFKEWSPWEKLDPNMTKEIGGGGVGVGATYYWKGNQEAGEGRMTITENVPDSRVGMKLEFLDWEMNSDLEMALQPTPAGTQATWSMSGEHNFTSKVMCVFMSMDSMVGKDFEEGLGSLGRLAESVPAMPDTTATPQAGGGM